MIVVSTSFLIINGVSWYSNWFVAVCDFRLDFDTFDTNAPSNSVETDNAHPCQDILTTTTNTGQSIPEICGTNAGQHSEFNVFQSST